MLAKIKDFVITGKEKAVVAFIVATVGSYIVQNGLTLKEILSWHGVWALAVGVISHLTVYFTTNSEHA